MTRAPLNYTDKAFGSETRAKQNTFDDLRSDPIYWVAMAVTLDVLSNVAKERVAMLDNETGFKQNRLPDSATEIQCPHCTSIQSKYYSFCGMCGKKLHGKTDNPYDTVFDALGNIPIFWELIELAMKKVKEAVESEKRDEE